MKFYQKIKFLPKYYDTRFSRKLSLYSGYLLIVELRVYIHHENYMHLVRIHETPHYHCACELLNSSGHMMEIFKIQENYVQSYLLKNNLVESLGYISYIEKNYPSDNPVGALKSFLELIQKFSNNHGSVKMNISILVCKRFCPEMGLYWLLMDGLHRVSILAALKEDFVFSSIFFSPINTVKSIILRIASKQIFLKKE